MDCSIKPVTSAIVSWPQGEAEFAENGVQMIVSFSGMELPKFGPLPPSNASILFACRLCQIKDIVADAFKETPNILRIDLSRNYLTGWSNIELLTFSLL